MVVRNTVAMWDFNYNQQGWVSGQSNGFYNEFHLYLSGQSISDHCQDKSQKLCCHHIQYAHPLYPDRTVQPHSCR